MYKVDVQYLPGKYMYVADFLSRNYITRDEKSEDSLSDVVHMINEIELKFENDKENEFKEATKKDETLSYIVEFLKNGWPKKCDRDEELKQYFKLKNDIILENGLIYLGMRLIVPRELKNYIVKKLHSTHLGITKTIKKSNHLFYWPGMRTDKNTIYSLVVHV